MERAPSIRREPALAITLLLFVLIVALDATVAGSHVVLGTAYVVPVLVAALAFGPGTTIAFALAGLGLAFASSAAHGALNNSLFVVRIVIVAVGGLVAVSTAALRARMEESLRRLGLLAAVADGFTQADDLISGAQKLLDALIPATADGGMFDVRHEDETFTRIAARWAGADSERITAALVARGPGERAIDHLDHDSSPVLFPIDAELLGRMAANADDLAFLTGLHLSNGVIVPLCVGGRELGTLVLIRAEDGTRRPFDGSDLELFEVAGSRAAAALDSARLLGELRRTEGEFSGILAALAEAVTVHDRAGRTVYANDAAARLISGDGGSDALVGAEPGAIAAQFDITREDGTPVLLADLPGHRLMAGDPAPPPLLTRSVVRSSGVERWLLTKVRGIPGPDGRPALAVNVIEDVTESKRTERAARLLAEAGEILGASRELAPTLQEIAELAVPELADWCGADLPRDDGFAHAVAIAHVDPARVAVGRELRARYPLSLDEAGGLAEVLRGGPTLVETDIPESALSDYALDADHLRLLREIGFGHVLICAMRAGGETVGALTFTRGADRRAFTAGDIALCEELARRTGIAVQGARLLQARAEVADTLQRSLLPPELPTVEGLTLRAFYQAAGEVNEVGGDFYDVFPLGEGWLAVIGDVTGKGAVAAALTSLTRSAIEAVATLTGGAEPALAHLNWLLHRRGELALCSVCCVRIVPHEGAAYVACAGHPPPLLIRDGHVEALGEPGALLGAFPEAQWREQRVALSEGDVIVLRTDGVTDAVGADGRLGEDRLRAVLAGVRRGDAADAIARVVEAVRAFQVGPQRDDTAIVAIGLGSAISPDPRADGAVPSTLGGLFIHERHELDGRPQSVSVARRIAERVLAGHVADAVAADVRLLVSELCANAVRHGGRLPYVLELSLAQGHLRLSVEDRGPGFAVRRPGAEDELAEGGYGLGLVARIAARWGIERGETTRVWCEIVVG